MNRSKRLSTPKGKSPGHIGIKAANYYQGLDEEQPSLFHLDLNSDSPSNTWSVSDITSEGSIRSGLSRATGTSTLEKIDEETLDEIELYEDEENEIDEDSDTPPKRSPESISRFIANFDAVDPRNTSQDNGPHDAMASYTDLTLSREEYFDEAAAHTAPVIMTPEEEQCMLDDFLLSFPQSPNDMESFVSAAHESQETSVAEEIAKARNEETDVKIEDEKEKNAFRGPECPLVAEENALSSASETDKVEDAKLDSDAEKESDAEGHDCSPVSKEDESATTSGMATAEEAKFESKIEDVVTPTALEQEGNDSCDDYESAKQPVEENEDAKDDASAAPCEESATNEASTATVSEENEKAPVVSPDTSNAKESGTAKKDGTPEVSPANDTNGTVTTQVCDTVNGKEEITKETIDETKNTIERVVSLEEPIGLAVGDSSLDDSLALSTYTTESDEEVSLNGWLARFLFELSADEICAPVSGSVSK
jgi:hypothetical protein